MKTKLFFFATLISFGLMSTSNLYSQTAFLPDFTEVLDLNYDETQTSAHVSPMDALIIINHLKGKIISLEVLFSGVPASVINTGSSSSNLDQFAVVGNSPALGQISMTITFTDFYSTGTSAFPINEIGTSPAAGRQKNRRVEMTIEFD